MTALDLWSTAQRLHVTGTRCVVALDGPWDLVPAERRPTPGPRTGGDAPCIPKPMGDALTVNLASLGLGLPIQVRFSRATRFSAARQLRLFVDDRTPQPVDGATIRRVVGQITLRVAELSSGDAAGRETLDCAPGMSERRRNLVRFGTVPNNELPGDQPNEIKFEGDLGLSVRATDVSLAGLAGLDLGELPAQPRVLTVRAQRHCVPIGGRIPVEVTLTGVVDRDHVPGTGYLPVRTGAAWDPDPGLPPPSVVPVELRIPAGRRSGTFTLDIPPLTDGSSQTVTVGASTDGADRRTDQVIVAAVPGLRTNPCEPVRDYRVEPPIFDPCIAADCWLVGIDHHARVIAVRDGVFVRALPEEILALAALPGNVLWSRIGADGSVLGAYTAIHQHQAGFRLVVPDDTGKAILESFESFLPAATAADGRVLGYVPGRDGTTVPGLRKGDHIEELPGFEDALETHLAGITTIGEVFGTVRLKGGVFEAFRWSKGSREALELPPKATPHVASVSELGCVAGTLTTEQDERVPFLWDQVLGFREITVPESPNGLVATGVSDEAMVAVVAPNEGSPAKTRSWLWHEDTGAVELAAPDIEGLAVIAMNGRGAVLATGILGGDRRDFRLLPVE